MKNLILTFLALFFIAQIGFGQTALIGSNQYAFQFTGTPNIGLYFSGTNTRYEFRDAAGNPEFWCNPINRINYFRGKVGVNDSTPSAQLDVTITASAVPFAVSGHRLNGPTNGYLGVRGDGTDFDGITGLSLYDGYDIGVLGLSTGSTAVDNYGVLGYSNNIAVIAENSVSGFKASLGTENNSARLDGKAKVINGEAVDLTQDGFLQLGTNGNTNMVLGEREIQVRNSGDAASLLLQNHGGNVGIGEGVSSTLLERFRVDADAGQVAMRIRVDGITKFRVGENGGTSIGSNFLTPPENGLYVNGDVTIGTGTPAVGYALSVDGKVICEELKVELSGSWPDYVFEKDYNLMPLTELENSIKENGHLPGIAPASAIDGNGIEIGEMQRLMMEKIEELTLYVIDLKKENVELRNLITSESNF